jgi:RluA family pseudouridine synthase
MKHQPTIKLSYPGPPKCFWEIPVLHEDEQLLAIDKPAPLLSSPDRYDLSRVNLMRLLHQGITKGAPWATQGNLKYLANAHRLDSEVTGVFVLAKDKKTLVALADQFGAEKPKQVYVALIRGTPPEDNFEVDAKIAPNPLRPGLMRVDSRNGKKSKTEFTVRQKFSGYTLIECRPLTARMHQIRAHLQYIQLLLIGDKSYGGAELLLSHLKSDYRLKGGKTERPLISNLALHAEKLTLSHPVTNEPIAIEAPWPKDLTVAVKYLQRYCL